MRKCLTKHQYQKKLYEYVKRRNGMKFGDRRTKLSLEIKNIRRNLNAYLKIENEILSIVKKFDKFFEYQYDIKEILSTVDKTERRWVRGYNFFLSASLFKYLLEKGYTTFKIRHILKTKSTEGILGARMRLFKVFKENPMLKLTYNELKEYLDNGN